jgi:AcrR family transcriptional regulator
VPGPSERRLTSQGQERKQQLLDCAARLFAERGYEETRIVDICQEAGVAKGLFYWYFENKETLFRELAGNIRRRLRHAQAEAMDPNADPLVRIAQGAQVSVRFMAEHAQFFALLEVENVDKQFVDVLRRGTDIHADDVGALIRQAAAAGLVVDDDPALLALGVVGTVGYYCHFHRTGRIDQRVDELATFVARAVVRQLAADDRIARRTMAAVGRPGLAVAGKSH